MRGRQPNPHGEALTAHQKRAFVILGGLLIVVVASLGAWAALSNGSYGRSADGCVTVVAPSSMGGAVLHACGSDARVMCRHAFTQDSKLDLLTRPQCRLAGLGPPGSP